MANIVAFLYGSVGENEITASSSQINVYPNPAVDYVTVASGNDIENIEIFNTVGQKVFNQNDLENNITINTIGFESGIYFVRIKTAEGYQTQKLSIK